MERFDSFFILLSFGELLVSISFVCVFFKLTIERQVMVSFSTKGEGAKQSNRGEKKQIQDNKIH